mgnify:FL=1
MAVQALNQPQKGKTGQSATLLNVSLRLVLLLAID